MNFKTYMLILLVVPVLSCRPKDLKCKKKETLVILELYNHYRELKHYRNLLLQSTDDSSRANDRTPSPIKVDTIRTRDNNMQVYERHPTGKENLNQKEHTNGMKDYVASHLELNRKTTPLPKANQIRLEKAIDELESIISSVRGLLLLFLLSTEKIGTRALDEVFEVLHKSKPIIGQSVAVTTTKLSATTNIHSTTTASYRPNTEGFVSGTTHPTLLYSTIHPWFFSVTDTIPFSTTYDISKTPVPMTTPPVPLSTTPTMLHATTHKVPNSSTGRTQNSKSKQNAQKNKRKSQEFKDAMSDYRDALSEINELFAEYRMMQRLLFGFRR